MRLVPGMLGIEWIAMRITATGEAMQFLLALRPTVAGPTQGLERVETERVVVAVVRRDMIADACWRNHAARLAQPAQRLDAELVITTALPCGGLVPRCPWHVAPRIRTKAGWAQGHWRCCGQTHQRCALRPISRPFRLGKSNALRGRVPRFFEET
jgi:hypothetical protein